MNQDEAQKKYGRILVYEAVEGFGDLIFKKPARADYMRFMSHLTDDKRDKAAVLVQFVKSCAVLPDVKGMDAVLDEYPGLVATVSSELQDMAAPDVKAVVKKGS